jgi:hypothetical protein
MNNIVKCFLVIFLATAVAGNVNAQTTTSWKGTSSTSWSTASNWTNGVPNSTTDVIIGDASFTGNFNPSTSASSACKNLTVGGTKSTTLTVNHAFTVNGSIVINANGILNHNASSSSAITLKGDLLNHGTYTGNGNSKSTLTFAGLNQTIGGTSTTSFIRLTINASATVTMAQNVTVAGTNSRFRLYGKLNPGDNPTYKLTTTSLTLYSGATLYVNGTLFTDNYSVSGTVTINGGATVNYSSTMRNQTIASNYSYSSLVLSGGTTKQLTSNLTSLNSSNLAYGNINVVNGIFDLGTFTANRGTSVTGGTFTLGAGATLKIGGTNAFPSNYNTKAINSTSTVEYNGQNQNITSVTYGNLVLAGTGGAVTKTTSSTAFTVGGDLTTNLSNATSLSFNTTASITVNGNVTLGLNTTLNCNTTTHNLAGNILNAGTINGSTGTINMRGLNKTIAGTGVFNFNNLTLTDATITVNSLTAITIAGNLTTTGAGKYTQQTGGNTTLSGASKVISGAEFSFSNLIVTGSISTSSNLIIDGNLAVSGTLNANGGTETFTGMGKTISGVGTIAFYSAFINGSIASTSSFAINNALTVNGSFTATLGTATFKNTAVLNGTANLYHVTINGTSLTLSNEANLGVAGTLTITLGVLNVTTSKPNTVTFNGTNAQNINGITYDNLVLDGGSTKTALNSITVNNNFTNTATTTFSAGAFTHTFKGAFVNQGTFVPSTGTVLFTPTTNVTISGETTFNNLTINTATGVLVVLNNNITAATVNIANGTVNTGINVLTVTNTRLGNGIIYGSVKHSHAFVSGTAYAFEGPNNTVTFTGTPLITSLMITAEKTSVLDFPNGAAVNIKYTFSHVGSLGSATAAIRLHYDDVDLNGNTEANMVLWKLQNDTWVREGKTVNNSTNNYVEKTGITNIAYTWVLADDANVVKWTGAVSTAWNNALNWSSVSGTPSMPPSATDIVLLGSVSAVNQPTISTTATVRSIRFESNNATTLSLASTGSLSLSNLDGIWTSNATHQINVGNGLLTINGDVVLGKGVAGQNINLTAANGNIVVNGSLKGSIGASINLTGLATLKLSGDLNLNAATFAAGNSTVEYNGLNAQTVAGTNYYNLLVNKNAGSAECNNNKLNIANNFTIQSGELDVAVNATVTGNININTGATLNTTADSIRVSGNWTNAGTFISGGSTVCFEGSSNQFVTASTFHNLCLNKGASTLILTGNVSVGDNVIVESGKINLSTYSLNRLSLGGVFMARNGVEVMVSGADNFPKNFGVYDLDTNSLVNYNGSIAQTIAGNIYYGNLSTSNGGATAKTLAADIHIKGNLYIQAGANLAASNLAVFLHGKWLNEGVFLPGTSTVFLEGVNKTLTGNTIFYNLMVGGSYTVNNNDITVNGSLEIDNTGAYYAGNGTHILKGDLTNAGILNSEGVTTFTGTAVQNIALINAITSVSSGVVNFNGTVAPILSSNTPPEFANVNINNTAGVTASQAWAVGGTFTVGSGALFNTGEFTHQFFGGFTNNGFIQNNGTMWFKPSATTTIDLGLGLTDSGMVNFGGTGLITIQGLPARANNLTISNINSAGVSFAQGWAMAGSFTIDDGAVFNAGNNTYYVGDNINVSGVLNPDSSTFILTGVAGEVFFNNESKFNHLSINGGASILFNNDVYVLGNFTNNGMFDAASPGTLVMAGYNDATVGGTSGSLSILSIEKINATVTLGVNLSAVVNLSINSGTLATSTYSITPDAAASTLNLSDNATFKLQGTSTIGNFTTINIDTFSTVEYAGFTQAIKATTYGNLVLSSAGTKTASGAITINNNFTLTNATFDAGSSNHILKGNWTMTSGLYNTTGALTLNGVANQVIKSTGAFRSLTINKASGAVYDSTDITVTNALTLTNGLVYTGANKINYTATSAPTHTNGYVVGRLQRLIPTNNNSSTYIFDLGDANNYTPVSLLFGANAVTKSGNITVYNTSGDHDDVANSQLAATKSVNKKWNIATDSIAFTAYSATFNYVSADVDAGANTSAFYVSKFANGNWAVLATGTKTSTSTQATGVNTAGDFVIGELAARVWDGGAANNLWSSANNWNPDGVPSANEDAWINTAVTPTINANVLVDELKITANSILNIGAAGSLTITGDLMLNAGTININGQTLTLNGTFNANGIGTITGSATSSIIIGGTAGGNFGVIRMTAGSPNNRVKNFTLNRTGDGAEVTIGTNGLEVTNLLNVTNGILRANGNLILVSDNNGTARVGQLIAPADVVGNVVVQRYIPAVTRRSRMLSPSTANFTFAQLKDDIFITGPGGLTNGFDASSSNGQTAYSYQESTIGTRGWKGLTNINNGLSAGKGALVFVRGDRGLPAPQWFTPPYVAQNQVTIDFVGELNKGTISPALTYTNTGIAENDGWNLVGNPYAAPIDWSLVNKTNLAAFYYVLNPASNSYIAYNGSLKIASGQAFFVQAIGANPAITFTEGSKSVNDATGNFKTSTTPFEIEIRKDSLNADLAWLNIDNNASRNYNASEDALKFYNATINLSFMSDDGVMQQYLSTPINSTIDTFKLDLQAPTGTYTLTFSHVLSLPTNNGAYFIDKYTQNTVNLATTNTYTFTVNAANAQTIGQRFILVINQANVLPVTWVNFSGAKQKNDVTLTWFTTNEVNNKGFEVQRQQANNTWQTIGFVKATTGLLTNKYNFVDVNVPANQTLYYRLKQVDLNGKATYSSIVAITPDELKQQSTQVYPNPTADKFSVAITSTQNTTAQITISDISGQKQLSQTQVLQAGLNTLNYGNLKTGVYFIEVITEGKKEVIKLLVK